MGGNEGTSFFSEGTPFTSSIPGTISPPLTEQEKLTQAEKDVRIDRIKTAVSIVFKALATVAVVVGVAALIVFVLPKAMVLTAIVISAAALFVILLITAESFYHLHQNRKLTKHALELLREIKQLEQNSPGSVVQETDQVIKILKYCMYGSQTNESIKEKIKELEIDIACQQAKNLINAHFSTQPAQSIMSDVVKSLSKKPKVNRASLPPGLGSINKPFFEGISRYTYRVTDTFSTKILRNKNKSINKTAQEKSEESQEAMETLKNELQSKLPDCNVIPLLSNISKFLTEACLISSFNVKKFKDNQSFYFQQNNSNASFEIMINGDEIRFKLATDLDIFFINEDTESILGYVRAERIVTAPLSLFTDYDWDLNKGGEPLLTQIKVSDTQTTHFCPKPEITTTPIPEEYIKEDNRAAQHPSPPKPEKSILKNPTHKRDEGYMP